ncbi:MAG: hypothetical protein RL266_294 [Bacteroidota bacterium]
MRVWNNVAGHFGPLDKAKIPTKEIVFVSDVKQLFNTSDPVKIEVVNGPSIAMVFIYQRESGAAHFVFNSQIRTEFFDERGFASAHFSRKNDDLLPFGNVLQVLTDTLKFRDGGNVKFVGQNNWFRPLR